jgi:hypothetical protein
MSFGQNYAVGVSEFVRNPLALVRTRGISGARWMASSGFTQRLELKSGIPVSIAGVVFSS